MLHLGNFDYFLYSVRRRHLSPLGYHETQTTFLAGTAFGFHLLRNFYFFLVLFSAAGVRVFRHLKLFARTFWAKLKNSIHAVLYTYIAVRGMTRKVSFQKPGFIKLSVVVWSLRICRNPRFSNCPKILSPTGSGWACKWELAGPVPGMVNAVLHQFPRTFPAKKQPEEDYRDGLGAAFSSLENKCHGMRAFRVYCTLPSPI